MMGRPAGQLETGLPTPGPVWPRIGRQELIWQRSLDWPSSLNGEESALSRGEPASEAAATLLQP